MVNYDGIYIVDTLAATINIKVMADYARKLIKEGLSAAQIVEKIETVKSKVKVIASLDTLEYLRRGGRIGRAAAAIGEMANLKPIITVEEEGVVGICGKCLGKNKAINFIRKHMAEVELDPDFPVYTVYTYDPTNCEIFEEKIAQDNIHIDQRMQIGATIGTHVGPGAFGLIYVKK